MVELENLKVSLTKNGYLKVATIVRSHPRSEMLDHVSGSHPGVNLVASQVANILCANPDTGFVPAFWDRIREYDRETVEAFTFLAIVYSHYRLIRVFLGAGQGTPRGTIMRSDFETEKEFTNLAYAMSEVGACPYIRGADQISYDMTPVTDRLRGVGGLVRRLFRAKLRRCGWRDPEEFKHSKDLPVVDECRRQKFNKVLGMPFQPFSDWLTERPRKPR